MRLADKVAAIERAVGSLAVKLRTGELTDGRTTWSETSMPTLRVKGGAVTLAGLQSDRRGRCADRSCKAR